MVSKIWIIFWKDLLMRKNHYFATILEVLLPIGVVMLANVSLPKYEQEIENDLMVFKELNVSNCIFRHHNYGNVMYEPSTPFTEVLMSRAACYAGYKKSNVKLGQLKNNASHFSIGVKFEGLDYKDNQIPDFLNYTLYPTNKVWANLLTLWRFSGLALPRYSIPFLHNIIEFQRAIDLSYLHLKTNISIPKLNVANTDLFGRSPRIFSIAIYFNLFLSLCLMVPPIVSRIVEEKFTGAKEMMLLMGVNKWQLWVAKFMDSILFLLLTVTGMIVFLYVPLKEDSNILTIPFIFLWGIIMYGLIGVIFFLFFLSCFFDKAPLAVYTTEVIVCLSFIFNYIISHSVQLPSFIKYSMCLFPHVAIINGVSVLLDFDFYGKSVNFTERLSGKSDYLCLLSIVLMMSVNIIVYALLTWYIEQVKPGKFGVPQSYNFLFKKSYWTTTKVDLSCNICVNENCPAEYESVPRNLKPGLSIKNLCKVYKSSDKAPVAAVKNININFYCHEISALLGHNGAGKTTVFSIITGFTSPTSGKVLINGYDLGVNVCQARRSLGFCPQQDMLFDNLKIEQILKFYGVVKGLKLHEAEREALELIKKLKLFGVRHTKASNLSGGQKRKVSLAIALIGGSEVLVLDEPTSGLDPEIRREIWEILLGFRGTKTILLTTHFMEEADALCDRIAIMDHGKIKCYGSPMFLKCKYGKGYVLSVVIVDVEKAEELTEYIKQFIPTAKFKSQNIRTLSYELDESKVAVFPALLSGLDEKQANNVITSYSISLTTLEDVFLSLKSDNKVFGNLDEFDSPRYKKLNVEELTTSKVSGCLLYLYQFWALIIKKWILFRRSYRSFLFYTILPALLVVFISTFSEKRIDTNHIKDLNGAKSLTVSAALYSPFTVLYSDHVGGNVSTLFEEFIKSLGCDVHKVPNINDAIYNVFKNDFYEYSRKLNLAVDFSPIEINILHNEDAVHMVPVALNMVHNFFLKLSSVRSKITTSIVSIYFNKESHPKPRRAPKCTIEDLPDFTGSQALFYLLGPIKEHLCGAKELQLMITPTILFWFSALLFDLFSFAIYILVVCFTVGLSQSDDFIANNTGEVVVSLLLWGVGLILLAYVFSTFMKDVAAAFSLNIIFYFVFTFIIYNAVYFGGLPRFFQYLHPTCIVKFGYADLCGGKESNYISALFLYDAFLFGFLILTDSGVFRQSRHWLINRFVKLDYSFQDVKDELVKQEEKNVKKLIERGNLSASVLIVDDLKRWHLKNFRPFPAVRGVSFSVNRGECFGLLGVNGAGKTSTFKMLIGSLPSSQGKSYICSKQLPFFNRQKCLFSIGYCPQLDGLIPVFKGRELLKFYARLRGLNSSQADEEVRKWLEKFDLFEFADMQCGSCSGGNQRKLSTAISLIGNCPLVFLDEPTTGVDPLSRRLMWDVINEIQKKGQSIVLTSHSMDECESLCSRLAIMVNGRFRCIGETITLKDKFGQGYCVQIKISNGSETDEEVVSELKQAIDKSFEPGCKLVDEHLTILQYHITNGSITWAKLFSKLKTLKDEFGILESYTASATTLEQVFMYFARNQRSVVKRNKKNNLMHEVMNFLIKD